MRLSAIPLLVGAVTLAVAADSPSTKSDADDTTVFAGKTVPKILELTPENFDEEIKSSAYTFVKHFSPYCAHCIAFAPTWQTLYEYYFTSQPEGEDNNDTNFTEFYDFKFAVLNCVSYGDLCTKNGVKKYPTQVIFNKTGHAVETLGGAKNMTLLSTVVEKTLEKSKPNTRPQTQLLPKPHANKVPSSDEKAFDKLDISVIKAEVESKGKDGETTLPTTKVSAAVVPVSTKIPNPNGQSVPLTAESFQEKVTMTQEPWFIKFYAPWCHHCQAMGPNWQQLGKEMQGKLNIGEVNCDKEGRLCKDVRVHGYPTILFFRGGERVEYDGLRGLGDFVQYTNKAIDICRGVPEVDVESLAALEEKEEVIFIYFYDHATTNEDFMALEQLPLHLIGHGKLVKTRDPALYDRYKITTWPRMLVSREGRPTYYTPLTPEAMRNREKVLNWMRSVWQPIVAELTAANAREIMEGKLVVLGILNREPQEGFLRAKHEMKSAANEWMDKQIQLFQLERQELRTAKQLRIEEAEDRGDARALRAAKGIRINMDKTDLKEVAFAWVDGIFWQRWIRTTYGIDIKDGERVIINDEDNRQYWDQTSTGNGITPSRTSILETLSKVVTSPPKLKPKFSISKFSKLIFDLRAFFSEHPWLTLGCIIGLTIGGASLFRNRLRRSTRGSFLSLDNASRESKGPLLGDDSNGKVD